MQRSPLRSALVALVLISGLPALTHAEWIPNGVPVSTAPMTQDLGAQAISDGAGGVFLFWRQEFDPFGPTPEKNIVLQHLGSSGGPAFGWPPEGKPITFGAFPPIAVADGIGGIVMAFPTSVTVPNGPNQSDIHATRLTSAGDLAPGWTNDPVPVCTAIGNQDPACVAPDGYGGMFVAWGDTRVASNGATPDLYVHHVLATGVVDPAWPVNGLGVSTGSWAEVPRALVTDGLTGVIVVWMDQRLGFDNRRLYAQRLTADGAIAPGWPVGGVSIAPGMKLWNDATAIPDGAGGVIVVWDDGRNNPPPSSIPLTSDIYAQRVTGAGTIAPGWPAAGLAVCTQVDHQFHPVAVVDGVGGAIIGWLDSRVLHSAWYACYALRVLPDGATATGWQPDGTPVATTPIDVSNGPQLATDGAGGAFFAWRDGRDPVDGAIYAQRLTAEGAIAPGWQVNGLPVCRLPSNVISPAIAEAGPARAIVAWMDDRNDPVTQLDIYAQEILGDAPVAIQVSLASSEVGSDFARLAWYTADGSLTRANVERRGASGDWETRATVYPDGGGRLTYEDHEVIAGSRYGYRLAWTEPNGDQHSTETWLDIPALALAIGGFSRTSGLRSVSMTLATDAPATLEVLDVAGRRVARQDLAGLGPGRHSVAIATRSPLAAGVYVLRLTQAGRVVRAKGVVFD